MALFISLLIFLDLAIIVFYVVYLLFRKPAPALERLSAIVRPRTASVEEGTSDSRPSATVRLQKFLKPLGEIAPKSAREVKHTRKQLLRAGYRARSAVTVFFGFRILAALLLPVLAYFAFSLIGPIPWNQKFGIMVISFLVGYLLPGLVLQARIRGRQDAIRRALPDALDLMVVCVEAGLGLDQSILRVSEELQRGCPELSEEFSLVTLEMRAGKARIEALRNLATRTGVDDVSSLVAMLIQTDRFGTSIAQSLRVHSDAMRVKRRQRAEEMASKVPVKLVFPIFLFVFPAIFIVTLAPAVLQFIRNVLPTMR